MYIANAFRFDDRAALIEFMRANAFAIIVGEVDGALFASHVPVTVHDDGVAVRLRGHVAKANPHWKSFGDADREWLAIFAGPDAYVSPRHYENRESVPTWNYIAVHAYGRIRALDEKTAMLEEMIDAFDAGYHAQWRGLPERFRDGMLGGIVGFEFEVTRVEGKAKLSQNRPRGDQERVAHSLAESDDPAARQVGDAMAARLSGDAP